LLRRNPSPRPSLPLVPSKRIFKRNTKQSGVSLLYTPPLPKIVISRAISGRVELYPPPLSFILPSFHHNHVVLPFFLSRHSRNGSPITFSSQLFLSNFKFHFYVFTLVVAMNIFDSIAVTVQYVVCYNTHTLISSRSSIDTMSTEIDIPLSVHAKVCCWLAWSWCTQSFHHYMKPCNASQTMQERT